MVCYLQVRLLKGCRACLIFEILLILEYIGLDQDCKEKDLIQDYLEYVNVGLDKNERH